MRCDGWIERRRRRARCWYGRRFRGLSPRPEAVLGLFCDFEGEFADPEAAQFSKIGLTRLLELLDELGLKVTFNVVAELCARCPELVQQVARAGHEIACHGWRHERPRDLRAAELDEMLRQAGECFAGLGLKPTGFRSPRSDWSVSLLRALIAHGYRWNAERDPAAAPYHVFGGLVRIPVATDDWDLVADPVALPRLMLKWRQRVDHAVARRRVVCIGLHEWLLGAHAGYAAALSEFLTALRAADLAPILPLGEIASSS